MAFLEIDEGMIGELLDRIEVLHDDLDRAEKTNKLLLSELLKDREARNAA